MNEAVRLMIINLARRPDRRARMRAQIASLDLRAEVFDAIDAEAVTFQYRAPRPALWRPDPLTASELACTQSHMAVWSAFLAGDEEFLCVLEDDVTLSPAFGAVVQNPSGVMQDFPALKLDLTPLGKPRLLLAEERSLDVAGHGFTVARLCAGRLGAGGYIVRRDAVVRLVDTIRDPKQPVDHLLFNPLYSPLFAGGGVGVLQPFVVKHDLQSSDLEGERLKQRAERAWRLRKLSREVRNARALPKRAVALAKGAKWKLIAEDDDGMDADR